MILSDTRILEAVRAGDIVVNPFDRERLGPNSYDVRLGPNMCFYERAAQLDEPLDCRREADVCMFRVPTDGVELRPGILYLGATLEYTESLRHLPYLDGKSSCGRLGISVHTTAGRGDVGFRGHWTLEITIVHRVRVYAGMPIAQLTWHEVTGEIERPYGSRDPLSYNNRDPDPQPSRMYKNFR